MGGCSADRPWFVRPVQPDRAALEPVVEDVRMRRDSERRNTEYAGRVVKHPAFIDDKAASRCWGPRRPDRDPRAKAEPSSPKGIEPPPGQINNDSVYNREDTHRLCSDPAGPSVGRPRQLDMEKYGATAQFHVSAEHSDHRAVSVCVPRGKLAAAADGHAAEDTRRVGARGRRAEVVACDLRGEQGCRHVERSLVRCIPVRIHLHRGRTTGCEERAGSRYREDEQQHPHHDPIPRLVNVDAPPLARDGMAETAGKDLEETYRGARRAWALCGLSAGCCLGERLPFARFPLL